MYDERILQQYYIVFFKIGFLKGFKLYLKKLLYCIDVFMMCLYNKVDTWGLRQDEVSAGGILWIVNHAIPLTTLMARPIDLRLLGITIKSVRQNNQIISLTARICVSNNFCKKGLIYITKQNFILWTELSSFFLY